jgi:hypothetical protein
MYVKSQNGPWVRVIEEKIMLRPIMAGILQYLNTCSKLYGAK